MKAAEVKAMFEHMQNVSRVMFNRAMWQSPIYSALSADGFKALSRTKPGLATRQFELEEPARYALGYAQIALVGTAIELTLLHLYVNSFEIFTKNGDVSSLQGLKSCIDSNPRGQTFDQFCALGPDEQRKRLKKLSFSNISEANKLFADIYGLNCLENAWTSAGYQEIREQIANLYTRRNGVLHRGGETVDGVMISVAKADLLNGFEEIREMMGKFETLSKYFLHHWIKKFEN